MVESRWEMKIGSPVMATDGEYGHLQEVIVDPQQGRVVALLVRKHSLLTPHIVVVPEQEVADASDNEVRLKISQEQINALLEYKPGAKLIVEGQKYEVDNKSFAVRGTQGFQVGRSPTERQPGMIESQFDQSERESLAIQLQPGKKVFCRDGHAGKVSLILLNPGGRVKGFVMDVDAEHPLDVDGGHLLGRSLIVPIERVQDVDKEYVHLSIDKSALENLQDYSPDFAIADEVHDVIWADQILRETDYKEIEVTAENGIVFLKGHVINSMNRVRAENAANLVRGVLGVENQLVVDEDLVIQVAQVLGSDRRTQLEMISVGAQNGVIILNGRVGSAAIREAAEELAASVPLVRGVTNYLHAPDVVIDPEEEQVRQPAIGREVYATDMLLGQVEQVIINPHNRRVIAFVVHGYFPEPKYASESYLTGENKQPEKRVVLPIHSVRYETESSTMLNISSNEAAEYRYFDAVDFVSPAENWEPPYPYHWGDVLFEKESKNGQK